MRLAIICAPIRIIYRVRKDRSVRKDRLPALEHEAEVVKAYAAYYNHLRTHLSLAKDAPVARSVQQFGQIIADRSSVDSITNTVVSKFRDLIQRG